MTPSAEHSSHAFLGTEEGEGEKKKKKTELGAYGYQRWYNDSP